MSWLLWIVKMNLEGQDFLPITKTISFPDIWEDAKVRTDSKEELKDPLGPGHPHFPKAPLEIVWTLPTPYTLKRLNMHLKSKLGLIDSLRVPSFLVSQTEYPGLGLYLHMPVFPLVLCDEFGRPAMGQTWISLEVISWSDSPSFTQPFTLFLIRSM